MFPEYLNDSLSTTDGLHDHNNIRYNHELYEFDFYNEV